MRTQTLSAISFGLLLLSVSGGCTVWHDLGHRPCDTALVIPHHNYMPRCTQVAYMDPAFYGYHPTCWSEWPEAWTACPPPATAEIEADVGEFEADAPTLAPDDSAAEPPGPPAPKPADWELVPVPEDAPSKTEAGSLLEDASVPPPGRAEQPAEAPEAEPPGAAAQVPQSRLESDAEAPSTVIKLTSAAQEDAAPGQSDWLLWVEEDDPPAPEQEPTESRKVQNADPSRHLHDKSADDQDRQEGWVVVEAR